MARERHETQPPDTAIREIEQPSTPRISLVIYHQEGAEIMPLAPGARLTIGRVPEADISIPDIALSRQHARVELVGDEVWIEDLGSSNGTRVNGTLVERRRRLLPGDDVVMGTVALSIHASARYARGLELHARFAAALDEEIARAATFDHELALLLVKEGEPQLFAEWSARVRQVLGPVDRIALHAAGVVEILLPETGLARARQRARRIAEVGGALRCGIAIHPGCGDDATELLEAATQALDQTHADEPIIAARRKRATLSGRGQTSPARLGGAAMSRVIETVDRVASSALPVLIAGETGVGKEVIARAIHDASARSGKPMRFINCGAIPRDLVQSVLFGHERGTFTGADQQRKGLFEQAHESTLLLDEVGELPPEAQVSLLRVLETRAVSRLGSSLEQPIDVRVISATHRDLETMCEAGQFRRDLLYRLNAVTIDVPPLRQRADELRPLAEHFLAEACKVSGVAPKTLAPEALQTLARYQWPGNVRELRNAMERAVLVTPGRVVLPEHLPERVTASAGLAAKSTEMTPKPELRDGRDPTPMPGYPAVSVDGPSSSRQPRRFRDRVRAYEATLLRRALERTGWNKTHAAEQLQMPLRTLMHKISTFGLEMNDSIDDTAPALAALDDDPRSFKQAVQSYEARLLLEALTATGWNKARAARQLGMAMSTLMSKIRSYSLDEG